MISNFQLIRPTISLPPEVIKLKTCSLESDKVITVAGDFYGRMQIGIVNLQTNSVSYQNLSADAASLNPFSNILAVRGSRIVNFTCTGVY